VIVVVFAVGTFLALRLHPFGIGGSVTTAPRQHVSERSTSSEKTATEKAATDKSGTGDTAASGTKPHEKATPTPGA